MSEQAGPISIEPWKQFASALQRHADATDWDKLVRVNTLLVQALQRAGKPTLPAEVTARKALSVIHADILLRLREGNNLLLQEIKQFKGQQDGLAAYQLTSLSGERYDI